MAGDGTIDLRGYIESYPQLPWMKDEEYRRHRAEFLRHHRLAHHKAAESGFTDLPPPEAGVFERHRRPPSWIIKDTEVIGSPGTDRIVKAANEASADKPLVIAVGGDLATVADAYLTDPSIAKTSVVYVRIGDSLKDPKFNIYNSGWSACIVLKKMRTVLLLCTSGAARIDRSRLRKLRDSPLAQYMLNKYFEKKSKKTLSGSRRWAGDAKALLAAAHPETVQKVRNARIVGLESVPWYQGDYLVPQIRYSDRAESMKVVTKQTGQTAAWWKHMQHLK